MKYSKIFAFPLRAPNLYDIGAAILLFAILVFFSHAAGQMDQPLNIKTLEHSSPDLLYLPYYSLRTFFRIIVAMCVSIIVTLVVGVILAKYHFSRPILLPIIDVLQSLPPLGFTSFLALFFFSLNPKSTVGLELAAITTIFISQVWNMILSFYKSLITIPHELLEATKIYRLSPWKKFWLVEVPFATPSLIMNAILSMSASWFFVVACEVLSVSGHNLAIPGMGSFIAWAIEHQNIWAISWAIITMFLTIVLYDQLLLRPLLAWSNKFQKEINDEDSSYESWFFDFLSRSRYLSQLPNISFNIPSFVVTLARKLIKVAILTLSISVILYLMIKTPHYIMQILKAIHHFANATSVDEIIFVTTLGAITALKVLTMVVVCTVIWVPIGVQIGIRPKLAYKIQPVIQLLAAFPPPLLYPIVSTMVVRYNLNVDLWTMLLMVLGTQWYILFNVIDGTLQLDKEQKHAIANFHLKGWLKWKRFYLPALTPSIITGAMAASGGCWNVCPESDLVKWGTIEIQAHGLGAYLHQASQTGDFHKIILAMLVMAGYVTLINKLIWQRLLEKLQTYY